MSKDDDLKLARETISELTQLLEKLGEGPLDHCSVLAATNETATVARGGSIVDLPQPPTGRVAQGDAILVAQSGLIKGRNTPVPCGESVTIERIIDKDSLEISQNGNTKVVLIGKLKDLKPGEQILLDSSGRLALKVVPPAKPVYTLDRETRIKWSDIGGHDNAKAELREAIELPISNPAIFKAYGHKPAKGILLSGPPGCGKTMLGKAAATAVAQSGPSAFMFIKGSEVLDPYVGVAEATVRSLFSRARAHKAENGTAAVIFIDEAEALLGSRGGRFNQMERTIVPTFLAEMDGIDDSGALVILATNSPDALDSAITRDGRIDRKIRIERPLKSDAGLIFDLHLKGSPLAGAKVQDLSAMAVEYLFMPQHVLFNVGTKCGHETQLTLGHISSGAMIAGIVGRAKSRALRRDLAGNGKASGISSEDLIHAINDTFAQSRDLDHEPDLKTLVSGREITHLSRPSV